MSLGVTVLHTPGHTPDELALYDADEKMLYVGDTLYEHEHIIFPKEGSIVEWMSSVEYLTSFVKSQTQSPDQHATTEVPSLGSVALDTRINSGHCTVSQPALEVLTATKRFMTDVLAGREPIKKRTEKRGEETVEYRQQGGRFSLICPERLVLEARNTLRFE